MKIAVTSPSFSKHPILISEMEARFSDYKLNLSGKHLKEEEELIQYLKGYQAAIIGLEEINKAVIDQLPDLKIIAKYGVGLNNIDLEYAKSKGITIGWTGGVNKLSVAEMVVGNVISLLRNLYLSSNLLSEGIWEKNGGTQLSGKTFGIIGVGHIGKEVIRLLKPFNCKIVVNDIIDQSHYYESENLIHLDKDQLFETSDIISIHTPLTQETKNLINRSVFEKMKSSAILINSARGGIVAEDDLKIALKTGQIGGAALDVYEVEPPNDLELLSLPNLICTPHIGGNAKEAVYAMGMSAIGHLMKFINNS